MKILWKTRSINQHSIYYKLEYNISYPIFYRFKMKLKGEETLQVLKMCLRFLIEL
jgi:hypothetical protein